jgi:REP element-mobilizing transposase RayT
LVLEVVQHSDGDRFLLHAAVVMDDHAHAIVRPRCGHSLEAIVRNWKACAVARLRIRGRVAPFWQREYHDRIIRSSSDLSNRIRYIAQNPAKRWPDVTDYAALYLRSNE